MELSSHTLQYCLEVVHNSTVLISHGTTSYIWYCNVWSRQAARNAESGNIWENVNEATSELIELLDFSQNMY
jgi:predicted deacetylase